MWDKTIIEERDSEDFISESYDALYTEQESEGEDGKFARTVNIDVRRYPNFTQRLSVISLWRIV